MSSIAFNIEIAKVHESIDETLNRIQALAAAVGGMVAEESSASYLVGMIEDLASDTSARNQLYKALALSNSFEGNDC